VIICVNVDMLTGYFSAANRRGLNNIKIKYYLRCKKDNELTKLQICSQKRFFDNSKAIFIPGNE